MVDPRKIAILGAGRIGESLISGLLSSGWREPSRGRPRRHAAPSASPSCASATASTRRSRTTTPRPAPRSSSSPSSRRTSRGCSARSATLILPEQTVLSVAAAIPTARIESRLVGRRPRRARDAEHAVDRARGNRRALRRRARGRRAPRPRRGGARRTSAPSSASRRRRSTRSPRSPAPAPRTSRSSPRR